MRRGVRKVEVREVTRTLLKWPVQLHGEPATDDRTLTDIKDQAFKVTSFTYRENKLMSVLPCLL